MSQVRIIVLRITLLVYFAIKAALINMSIRAHSHSHCSLLLLYTTHYVRLVTLISYLGIRYVTYMYVTYMYRREYPSQLEA